MWMCPPFILEEAHEAVAATLLHGEEEVAAVARAEVAQAEGVVDPWYPWWMLQPLRMQDTRVKSSDGRMSCGSGGGGEAANPARHERHTKAMWARSHSHGTRRAISDIWSGERFAQGEGAAMVRRVWELLWWTNWGSRRGRRWGDRVVAGLDSPPFVPDAAGEQRTRGGGAPVLAGRRPPGARRPSSLGPFRLGRSWSSHRWSQADKHLTLSFLPP